MDALAAGHDAAVQMIDTSIVRVHQHGACIADNRHQGMGRSRGGLTSKIHAMKSIRECKARVEIDLETLIWTRGEKFPISMRESRLKCSRCGSRRVVLMFGLPGQPVAKHA
jgi:hypothetical protein